MAAIWRVRHCVHVSVGRESHGEDVALVLLEVLDLSPRRHLPDGDRAADATRVKIPPRQQLTTNREPKLLAALRARAVRPLIDIGSWSDVGHAAPGLILLGRIQGRRDEEIFGMIQRGERTAIIEEAKRMLNNPD